jgi:hypothetical protein
MNLEYYDVQDFFQNLAEKTRDRRLKTSCLDVADFIRTRVVVYEKHTADCSSNGLSIFFSNYMRGLGVFQSRAAAWIIPPEIE